MTLGSECTATAPTCMFIHSAYDMSNLEIADTLDAHASVMGYSTMLFDPAINYAVNVGSTGVLQAMNVH